MGLLVSCRFLNQRLLISKPDSKVHGAYIGPIWGRQDPGWPHIASLNLATWKSNKTQQPSGEENIYHYTIFKVTQVKWPLQNVNQSFRMRCARSRFYWLLCCKIQNGVVVACNAAENFLWLTTLLYIYIIVELYDDAKATFLYVAYIFYAANEYQIWPTSVFQGFLS